MDRTSINQRLIQVAAGKRRHEHYDRTVERAAYYRALSTGANIEPYLRRYYKGTSMETFDVLCKITSQVTPSICSGFTDLLETSQRSFYRREVSFGEDEANESKTMEFEAMLKAYDGGKGMDTYLQERHLELQGIDPNTWIVEQWKPFDPVRQYAQPYPFEVSSAMALDFDYETSILQYLTVQTYKPNPANPEKPLSNLVCFQIGFSSTLTQTTKQAVGTDLIEAFDGNLTPGASYNIGGAMWVYNEYYDDLTEIKAKRVGYRRDMQTNGKTFVWPWVAAEPSLNHSLKITAELQFTSANVAFPTTIRFGDPCEDEEHGGCGGEGVVNGHVCKKCGGTGTKKTATSSIEEIVVKIDTRNMDVSSMPKLSELIYRDSPDVSILDWMEAHSEKVRAQAWKDFTGSDVTERPTATQTDTATAVMVDRQKETNQVYKYFVAYASFWQFTVYAIAEITGKRDGLNAQIFVGKDLKLKTIGELMVESQEAHKTGNRALIASIDWDIARVVTLDSPEDFIEYQIQARFDPFSGASPDERIVLAADTNVPLSKRVLNANLGWIFKEIEIESPGFYKMPFEAQRTIVDAKVQSIIDETKGQQAANAPQIALPLMSGHTAMPTMSAGNPDKQFAMDMIPHHKAAIPMAEAELKSGTDAGMKALAANIVKTQTAEIATMEAFLGNASMTKM